METADMPSSCVTSLKVLLEMCAAMEGQLGRHTWPQFNVEFYRKIAHGVKYARRNYSPELQCEIWGAKCSSYTGPKFWLPSFISMYAGGSGWEDATYYWVFIRAAIPGLSLANTRTHGGESVLCVSSWYGFFLWYVDLIMLLWFWHCVSPVAATISNICIVQCTKSKCRL